MAGFFYIKEAITGGNRNKRSHIIEKKRQVNNMLMYPEEYRDFARLVKKVTLLDVLERALRVDHLTVTRTPFKLRRPIERQFEKIKLQVERDLIAARRSLREMGGEIIEVQQLKDVREVKARFRGFLYTQSYMNELLRGECERLLSTYWITVSSDEREHPIKPMEKK